MSFYEEVGAFQKVSVPETKLVQNNIERVLDGFNQMAKLEVRKQIVEVPNDTIQVFVERILAEGKIFCKLTHDSVVGSDKIANYCTDIISYVETLSEQKISVEDFHEAIEELLLNANKCKNEAVILWKGYTQICQNLKDIYDDLKIYDQYLEGQKVKHERTISTMNEDKKEAKAIKWTYIVSSAGMTVLAPASLGITLVGSAVLGYLANEKAEEEKVCRLNRNESRAMVEKLNGIRDSVSEVVTQ